MSQLATDQLLNEKDQKIAQLEQALALEAALERVRSRIMWMQRSHELRDVVSVMYNEMELLGLAKWGCNIMICHQDKEVFEFWLAEETDANQTRNYFVKGKAHPIYRKIWTNWENQTNAFTLHHQDEYKLAFDKYWLEETDFKHLPDEVKANVYNKNEVFLNYAPMKHGLLNAISYEKLSDKLLTILARFAKVFEQTYTRFLELEKAEAQTKEAQIEAALERVRAASMAMHKSTELPDVALVLVNQLAALNINQLGSSILIVDGTKDTYSQYAAHDDLKSQKKLLKVIEDKDLTSIFLGREILRLTKAGETAFNFPLKGDNLEEFIQDLIDNKVHKERGEAMRQANFECVYFYFAIYHELSPIVITTLAPLPEIDQVILKRMATTFGMSYRRFLDLQKAEAQAREAQIEAAMERIRSRAIAMRSSDELKQVIIEMRRQIDSLGQLDLEASVIHLYTDGEKMFESFAAVRPPGESGEIVIANILFPVDAMEQIEYMIDSYYSDQQEYTIEFDKKMAEEWQEVMVEYAPMIAARRVGFVANRRTSDNPEYWNFADFSHGSLLLVTHSPASNDTKEVLRKASQVFEQTYTRFLDLQKAEAQAREAQIETALERVRASTMAMHHSSDLTESAAVLFEQIQLLGAKVFSSGFVLCEENNPMDEQWMSVGSTKELIQQYIPHEEEPHHFNMYKAWQAGGALLAQKMEGKALQAAFAFLSAQPSVQKNLEKIIDKNTPFPTLQILHAAYFSKGYLLIVTTEEYPEKEIFIRFAKVFEQTYTRFLDLQKAEAQAREAQIEAALERVRARTMAMHKSEELPEAAKVMFEQFKTLGLEPWVFAFCIFRNGTPIADNWASSQIGPMSPMTLPHQEDPVLKALYNAWKAKSPLHVEEIHGKRLAEHYEYMLKINSVGQSVKEMGNQGISLPEQLVFNCANFKYGYIMFCTHEPKPAYHDIFIRFTKVFEQTYTRFLDLQKAEAQAKEAQIEAALERVRARTMAMHKSAELADTASVLFQQLKEIGINIVTVGLIKFDEANKSGKVWLTPDGQVVEDAFAFPLMPDPTFKKIYTAWKKKAAYYIADLKGKKLQNHLEYVGKYMPVEEMLAKADAPVNNRLVINAVFYSHGFLALNTLEPLENEMDVLQRFANVFEQTYTRFLDLQKVEAQAREAQIEAALEKIRNRTLLMKDSSELNEAVATFFQQFKSLGLLPGEARAFFGHISEEKHVIQAWMTRMDGTVMSGSHFTPLDTPSMLNFHDAWKRQSPILIRNYEGEALKKYLKFVASLPHVKKDKDYQQLFQSNPERIVMTDAFFLQGSINMMTFEPLSQEAQAMLVRFAKVFEFTYTRFLDLKRAEAQAKEAQIEAILERVRSRTMAMQKSEELKEVVNSLFGGLEQLNYNPIDCTILTLNEKLGSIECWSTVPTEKGYAAYTYSLVAPEEPFMKKIFQAHRAQNPAWIYHLKGKEKVSFDNTFFEVVRIPEMEAALRSLNSIYANFVFMPQSAIAVFSDKPMENEDMVLLQRFSKVVNLCYTRFLDLQKAEEQTRQIEKVFNENQRLLHSILPEQIAEQIRQGQQTVVKRFEEVSILFADIVGFTILSEKLSPQKVVDILNGLFSKFDDLTDKYQLEKIKTIGDAYMVASGVPEEKEKHALVLFQFAQEMLTGIQRFNQVHNLALEIRIGISSGPVVAGVIGKKKFAYDLWGDTVNTAARMEAYGQASCIQLAPTSYELLKNDFVFEKIPNVAIKGKGTMDVYLWTAAQEILN